MNRMEVLRPSDWYKLEKFCEKHKFEVPDSDTNFVVVQHDVAGEIIGFVPVQPIYAAGPASGAVNFPRALEAIDEHFLLHFGSNGFQYVWFHPKSADRAQIRTVDRKAKSA